MKRETRRISLGDRVWDLEILRNAGTLEVWIDGVAHRFVVLPGLDGTVSLSSAGGEPKLVRGYVARDKDRLWVHAERSLCFAIDRSGGHRRAAASTVSDSVHAPMTGTVRRVLVAPTDAVVKGQPLVLLEAMKMEHVLRAPREGVVLEVNAVEGTQAEAHSVLVRLRPDAPRSAPSQDQAPSTPPAES
jgi:acetyl/propionyl-CoA carboxylase alpha subunit